MEVLDSKNLSEGQAVARRAAQPKERGTRKSSRVSLPRQWSKWPTRWVAACYRAWLACPFGWIFLLCPQRQRLGLAQCLARALRPVMRVMLPYREPRLDGHREAALRSVLLLLDRAGVRFDNGLQVTSVGALSAEPKIILSGHLNMNRLLTRWLHEQGQRITSVMTFPPPFPRIFGTDIPIDVIRGDEMVLVKMRHRLAEGRTVIVYVDGLHPSPRSISLAIPDVPLYVSENIFRFAERLNVPVFFSAARVAPDGTAIARIVRSVSSNSTGMRDEFCEFLRAEAAACQKD